MRCAVLGDPIGHSLSPVLHRAAYAALGLDWSYDAVRVPAGGLEGFLDGLDDSWRGLSLTMPLKREVIALLTSRDEWVAQSGVANTLLLDEHGRHGLNTDVPGAIAAIRQATDAPVDRAVVLGGGATAASMVLALAELGCHTVTLLVRDPDRAAEAAAVASRGRHRPDVRVERLGGLDSARPANALGLDSARPADGLVPDSARPADGLDLDSARPANAGGLDSARPADGLGLDSARPANALAEADIVVSTIPAEAQTPALVEAAAGVPVVFDVVYDPWPTPLVAEATTRGHTTVTGLDLLLWQAVDQVRAMTGRFDVPVDTMREAGVRALAAL